MYKTANLETIVVMLKTYYATLRSLPELWHTNLYIKINSLELEYWTRTGSHFHEVHGGVL